MQEEKKYKLTLPLKEGTVDVEAHLVLRGGKDASLVLEKFSQRLKGLDLVDVQGAIFDVLEKYGIAQDVSAGTAKGMLPITLPDANTDSNRARFHVAMVDGLKAQELPSPSATISSVTKSKPLEADHIRKHIDKLIDEFPNARVPEELREKLTKYVEGVDSRALKRGRSHG
jgi:hypothetical protein